MKIIKYIKVLGIGLKVHFLGKKIDKKLANGRTPELESEITELVHGWANELNRKMGVKLTVEGIENLPNENCFFVANHQSYFDIVAIIAGIEKPLGFIAKKELQSMIVGGKWMERIKCKFLDRENPRQAVKTMQEAAEELKSGYSMVIFPEGTRSKSDEIGDFKKGSLKIATKAKDVPVVPLTITGSYHALEEKGLNSAKINLFIHKPIYPNTLEKDELSNLASTCREIIASKQEEVLKRGF